MLVVALTGKVFVTPVDDVTDMVYILFPGVGTILTVALLVPIVTVNDGFARGVTLNGKLTTEVNRVPSLSLP